MRYFCGYINFYLKNKIIILYGWIYNIRNYGSLVFIDLKDRTGIIQIVLLRKICNFFFKFLKLGSCVKIVGILVCKNIFYFNKLKNLSNLEIICLFIFIINLSKNLIFKFNSFLVSEFVRLKNRFLDLRNTFMQFNLIIRFIILKYIRIFLNSEMFLEIETPVLTKSTPEGARDYLIPSRFKKGFFYSLPQSPQIFKQILMISSFDRYYQIVKCFRDENLRSDRQPEFTQLDCELSFINDLNICFLFETLILFIIFKILNYSFLNKFLILNYSDSIKNFFTDKPNLRFKLFILNFLNFSKFFFYKFLKKNCNFIVIKLYNGLNLFGKNFKNFKFLLKFLFKERCVFFLNFNNKLYSIFNFINLKKKKKLIFEIFSYVKFYNYDLLIYFFAKNAKNIKIKLNKFIKNNFSSKYFIYNNIINYKIIPLWVVNFPLFKKYFNKYNFNHNPFSLTILKDVIYLDYYPLKCNSFSYDIIINGVELGGGSLRNNKSFMQKRVFYIINNNISYINYNFGFFLKSLNYGTPSHGGIAIGVDRFISIILGLSNIREIIAFPKTRLCKCLLTNSPSLIVKSQLIDLFL